jgi:tetrahydromethanopterin S-methyltransferase subunit G
LRGRKMHSREIGPALEEMQRRLDALEEGQQRIGAGDDAQARLNEVEERLDFVERMLAKQRDAERVSPPKP